MVGSGGDRAIEARCKLLTDIEAVLRSATTQSRGRIFSAITGLFLLHARALDDELIALFDEVFARQIPGIDTDTLAAASDRLAPIPNAPPRLVQMLARHGVIAIAEPMLTHAPGLSTADLIGLAGTLSVAHRVAIAGRAAVDEQLSGVLIDRGEAPVMDRLATNPGARFHIGDFGLLLARATSDERARIKTQMRVTVLKFGGALAGHCSMVDISPGGAKLTFDAPVDVPEMFTLELIPAERKQIASRVVWRRGSTIGLRFTTSLIALWEPESAA